MSFASYLAENKNRLNDEKTSPPVLEIRPTYVVTNHGISKIESK